MNDLKKRTIEEIKKIGIKIEMPSLAINRLLETLNKHEANSKKENFNVGSSIKKDIITRNKDPKTNNAKAAQLKINSSYYHFLNTSKEEAVRYNAKKINNVDKAEWKTHLGHSSWNPGNTTESKDFTKQAKEKLRQQLLNFSMDNLLFTRVGKIEGDFTVICTRGKVKYIYDISFEADWSGIIANRKVNGKLEISDIMSDDNYDDWNTICKTGKINRFQDMAKNKVLSKLPDIDVDVIQSILKYIKDLIINS